MSFGGGSVFSAIYHAVRSSLDEYSKGSGIYSAPMDIQRELQLAYGRSLKLEGTGFNFNPINYSAGPFSAIYGIISKDPIEPIFKKQRFDIVQLENYQPGMPAVTENIFIYNFTSGVTEFKHTRDYEQAVRDIVKFSSIVIGYNSLSNLEFNNIHSGSGDIYSSVCKTYPIYCAYKVLSKFLKEDNISLYDIGTLFAPYIKVIYKEPQDGWDAIKTLYSLPEESYEMFNSSYIFSIMMNNGNSEGLY